MPTPARIHPSGVQPLPRSLPTLRAPAGGSIVAKETWTLLRASQELRPERGAIDLRASQVDLIDLVRVGNVLQGIGVQHDEVGFLAGGHHAHPSQSENPRVNGRCRLNRLGGRESAARVVGDLLVGAEAVAGSVGPESDDHTGVVDFPNVAAVKLE